MLQRDKEAFVKIYEGALTSEDVEDFSLAISCLEAAQLTIQEIKYICNLAFSGMKLGAKYISGYGWDRYRLSYKAHYTPWMTGETAKELEKMHKDIMDKLIWGEDDRED